MRCHFEHTWAAIKREKGIVACVISPIVEMTRHIHTRRV